MNLEPTIKINLDEFRRTLNERVRLPIKGTLDVFINRQLLFVLRKAFSLTPRADKGKIEADLGTIRTTRTSKKTGKVRTVLRHNQTPSAVNIVQWRLWKAGKKPLNQVDAKAAARKMVGQRLRAVGSLASGWVASIIRIAKATGEAVSAKAEARIKQKGGATPAKPGWNPMAMAEYELLNRKGDSSSFELDPRIVPIAQEAFDAETRKTKNYLAKHLMEATPYLTK